MHAVLKEPYCKVLHGLLEITYTPTSSPNTFVDTNHLSVRKASHEDLVSLALREITIQKAIWFSSLLIVRLKVLYVYVRLQYVLGWRKFVGIAAG